MESRYGVLAMAYGTPSRPEEIEPYYTHIRRGRPPEPHQLADLVARYEAIGGLSPLNELTKRQAAGLESTLNEIGPDAPYRIYVGMKHARPFIDDVVKQMANDGIERVVTVVLAPHYSTMSVAAYNKTAQEAAASVGLLQMSHVNQWYAQPDFVASTVGRVRGALDRIPEAIRADTPIIFTAHSLPERILQVGDPYPKQIQESARMVAEEIGHERWLCGWQSAGRTPDPWLGPDLLDILTDLATQGNRFAVVCPIGFVSDHLEVLYDIDIEAKAHAHELGMQLVRVASPNDEPLFLRAVARAVIESVADPS